jgi:rod shape-determining protein MreD
MGILRGTVLVLLLLLAAVLQVSFFGFFALDGVVPDLVLLVVVAVAVARGPEVAAPLGFVGGMVLDLAPPADHLAGRWALALVLAAYVVGRVRQDASRSTLVALVTVAAASFLAASVFALSGMALGDTTVDPGTAIRVVLVSVGYDLLLAPFVLPLVFRLLQVEQRESRASRVPAPAAG